VYARLAPAVLEELRKQTPRDAAGRLKHKLFQRLTSDEGHPKLKDHFRDVLTLMRASRNWREFYALLDRSLPRFTDTLQLPFDDTQAMESLPMKQISAPASEKPIRRV
jgi:hypothetical protein